MANFEHDLSRKRAGLGAATLTDTYYRDIGKIKDDEEEEQEEEMRQTPPEDNSYWGQVMGSVNSAIQGKMTEASEEMDKPFENPFKKLYMEMIEPLEDSDEEGEIEEGRKYLDEKLQQRYPESGLDTMFDIEDMPGLKNCDMFGRKNIRRKANMKYGIESQCTGDDFAEKNFDDDLPGSSRLYYDGKRPEES